LSMILRPVLRLPQHPFLLARFGVLALLPARRLTSLFFKRQRSRALFAGIAAHSMLSLDAFLSGSFGLILGCLGHAVGWPLARGGSQRISDALAGHLRALGGGIQLNTPVDSIDALSSARLMLLDVTPRQLLGMGGSHLPHRFQKRLQRYRYGPGAFKLDYALDGPVPWKASECRRAGTVHLGGTLDEIAKAEAQVSEGEIPERPFVLVAQPSLFDSNRAPEGKHILWVYCHVPNGAGGDMTRQIEAQIERFAPGFQERILERRATGPRELERSNANYIGGDINGGLLDIRQFITRPTFRPDPYRTPVRGLYLCSASTPPGGGVHGMCGYNAAVSALRAES
jgi:phytoene dehydrogenase-like protein